MASIRFQTSGRERNDQYFMEKRVLLAIVLSFVVLYGFQAMFPPPKPQPKPAAAQPAAPPAAASSEVNRPVAAEAPPLPAASHSAPLVADASERDVTFENEAVSAVFTTRGGA